MALNGTAVVMGSYSLVRALGLAGIGSVVVTRPGDPLTHSRFVRGTLPWLDFERNQGRLVEELLGLAAGRPEPPVLYFEQDRQLLIVSRNRDRLARDFRFVLAEAELVEDLVDKARFQHLADRLKLPVPPARRIDPLRGGPPGDLSFPLLLKPLTRLSGWSAITPSGKALRIGGRAELDALWPRINAAGASLLAQELIPGPEAMIESYHVYLDGDGNIAGEFTGRKIRTYPREFGHSTALALTQAADVAALGRELVGKLGLRGVAKFDFKRAPDGRLFLLEVNPRFNLWHFLGAVAGPNLPALVFADLTGQPRPAPRSVREGACWCQVPLDRRAAREEGIGLASWLVWMAGCDAKALTWDDPRPLLTYAGSRLRSLVLSRSAPEELAQP